MRWILPVLLLAAACASSSVDEIGAVPVVEVTSPTDGTGDAEAVSDSDASATAAGDPISDPTGDSIGITPDGPGRPSGFDTTRAVVTAADGTTCEICVWLAETASQRSRGLMYVTDLGIGEAMAFVYPQPRTGTFWMKSTILPLSIAFFAPDGAFMTSFDMEPCTTPTCPNYATADGFLVALEVPEGGLDDLGVGPGSTLELLDLPCP